MSVRTPPMPRDHRLPPLPPRYRAVDHLAAGGMSTILAADDSALGRMVAIKLLAPHLADDPGMVARFEREARAAASLSGHPHIVTIYDVDEYDGRPMIVMEYLPGGTLADAVHRGDVPPAQAVRWLGQAADALDAAHELGIVHRDVKPGNLLLDARGDLVVADFGIARLVESETITSTHEILGTAAYISPEQAVGDRPGPASDRYSLAVVAFELLTGRRPFEGSGFAAQARAHVDDPPPLASQMASGLPPEVDAVLLKGMAKKPERRFGSAAGFVRDLSEALGLQTPATARQIPAATTRRLGQGASVAAEITARTRRVVAAGRRPRWAVPIAIFLLASLVALLLAAGGDSPSSDRGTRQTSTDGLGGTSPARQRPPLNPGEARGAALNDKGFALMQAGHYHKAVDVLRKAVAAFPAGTEDMNYAYALFNLGRSLRLSGNPAEAIPILEQRLQIPNQRDAVQRELEAARREAGQREPAPGKKKGHGKHLKGD